MNARLTAARPLVLLAVLTAVLVAACASSSASPGPSDSPPPGSPPATGEPPSSPPSSPPSAEGGFGSLVGTGWRVVRIDDVVPVAGSEPTIAFKEGRIEGTTGCNSYGGSVEIHGSSMEAGDMAMTLIGCSDPISEMERAFLAALAGADELAAQGANLVIRGSAGEILLRPDATVR